MDKVHAWQYLQSYNGESDILQMCMVSYLYDPINDLTINKLLFVKRFIINKL